MKLLPFLANIRLDFSGLCNITGPHLKVKFLNITRGVFLGF